MQNDVTTHEKEQAITINQLTEKVEKLMVENVVLTERLEKALLYIEELQRIVFRRKKIKNKDDDDQGSGSSNDSNSDNAPKAEKAKRDPASYRRKFPPVEAVTGEVKQSLPDCPDCHGALTRRELIERYEEDIAPLLDWASLLKKVTKHTIETGYCGTCDKRVSVIPIPKQTVSLGKNIRELVVFQNTIQQLSYSQIADFTKSVLQIELSEGEITNILESQANRLELAYVQLIENIRQQPAVHIDESAWKTPQGEGNYVWGVVAVNSPDTAYVFGKTRGKKHIAELLGEDFDGVGISDDYNAYKYAFVKYKHALCWAHPERKLRDLMNSECLTEEKLFACQATKECYSELYEEIREIIKTPFVASERQSRKERLMSKFKTMAAPNPNDPAKLAAIKRRLLEQRECYFVCVTTPDIPADNNAAERSLRHLVIKRKKCQGSKTKKGAHIMSVLYSVVMSLWRRSKPDFFRAYHEVVVAGCGWGQ